jgi:hypothetical protein
VHFEDASNGKSDSPGSGQGREASASNFCTPYLHSELHHAEAMKPDCRLALTCKPAHKIIGGGARIPYNCNLGPGWQ